MGIDLDAIRNRLNKLQTNNNRSTLRWKPEVDTATVIRIVPNKFSPDVPFHELYFHYNIGKIPYLSPISFGRPDPIVEFTEQLKRTGDSDDWKLGRKYEPKLRTFAPIIVRGEEDAGVRFWGFGKTVYEQILTYIADPDYGDITDPTSGRDIKIIYKKPSGENKYPETNVMIKPNQTPLHEDAKKMQDLLENQSEITDLYDELSYDELNDILNKFLKGEDTTIEDTSDEKVSTPPAVSGAINKGSGDAELEEAFDDLFEEGK